MQYNQQKMFIFSLSCIANLEDPIMSMDTSVSSFLDSHILSIDSHFGPELIYCVYKLYYQPNVHAFDLCKYFL